MHQHTLRSAVSAVGIGLHSGERVQAVLRPAPENYGWNFVRTDVPYNSIVSVGSAEVVETMLCTGIGRPDRVRTIEHLMASLRAMNIDNVFIELNQEEVPIFDGSAAPWVHLIKEAGIEQQKSGRRVFFVRDSIEVEDRGGWMRLEPDTQFTAHIDIDFDHPAISNQNGHAAWDGSSQQFEDVISRARTFGFMDQVEAMAAQGLGLGGSTNNAVVYDNYMVVNREGLRVVDEAAQHKLLDVIGDMTLLGRPLMAKLTGYKPGHTINQKLVRTAKESGLLLPMQWDGWQGRWVEA